MPRYRRPFSWYWQKPSVTALESMASMVKRSLDQSSDDPSERSWLQMRPPFSFFHSNTFSMNFSRP